MGRYILLWRHVRKSIWWIAFESLDFPRVQISRGKQDSSCQSHVTICDNVNMKVSLSSRFWFHSCFLCTWFEEFFKHPWFPQSCVGNHGWHITVATLSGTRSCTVDCAEVSSCFFIPCRAHQVNQWPYLVGLRHIIAMKQQKAALPQCMPLPAMRVIADSDIPVRGLTSLEATSSEEFSHFNLNSQQHTIWKRHIDAMMMTRWVHICQG